MSSNFSEPIFYECEYNHLLQSLVCPTEENNTEPHVGINTTSIPPELHHLTYSSLTSAVIVTVSLLSAGFIIGINATILQAFYLEHELRHPSNYFYISLAVADLLIGIVSVPFSTIFFLFEEWPLGHFVCDFYHTMDWSVCSASVFATMLITSDRFLSVWMPNRYRHWRSHSKTFLVVIVMWIVPFCTFCPLIMVYHMIAPGSRSSGHCDIEFLKLKYTSIVIGIVYFWLPLILMVAMYGYLLKKSYELQRKVKDKEKKMKSWVGRSASVDTTSSRWATSQQNSTSLLGDGNRNVNNFEMCGDSKITMVGKQTRETQQNRIVKETGLKPVHIQVESVNCEGQEYYEENETVQGAERPCFGFQTYRNFDKRFTTKIIWKQEEKCGATFQNDIDKCFLYLKAACSHPQTQLSIDQRVPSEIRSNPISKLKIECNTRDSPPWRTTQCPEANVNLLADPITDQTNFRNNRLGIYRYKLVSNIINFKINSSLPNETTKSSKVCHETDSTCASNEKIETRAKNKCKTIICDKDSNNNNDLDVRGGKRQSLYMKRKSAVDSMDDKSDVKSRSSHGTISDVMVRSSCVDFGTMSHPIRIVVSRPSTTNVPKASLSEGSKVDPSTGSTSSLLKWRSFINTFLNRGQESVAVDPTLKATLTTTLILGSYIMFFGPYHIVMTVKDLRDLTLPTYVSHILYFLFYLNSAVNPFIYAYAKPMFNRTFKRILRGDCRKNVERIKRPSRVVMR